MYLSLQVVLHVVKEIAERLWSLPGLMTARIFLRYDLLVNIKQFNGNNVIKSWFKLNRIFSQMLSLLRHKIETQLERGQLSPDALDMYLL